MVFKVWLLRALRFGCVGLISFVGSRLFRV